MTAKKVKKEPASTVISNNTFTGVHWDKDATVTVQTVADALLVNAKALHNLATLFYTQNIQIETMLKLSNQAGELISGLSTGN
jgi:hypothetical protein